VIDLTPVGYVCGTAISWEATMPPNTSVIIETSIDGGVTWQACTNKGRIPGINYGDNLVGKQLLIREKLSTSDVATTSQLNKLTLAINHEEWAPLGTFWSEEWSAPQQETYAKVVARDRLNLLQYSTYSTSTVQQNKTFYELAEQILQDAGLKTNEYWVDNELNNFIAPYAYFDNQSHREALRKIAEACLGQVYCDRDGLIRVEGPSYLANKIVADEAITQEQYYPPKDNPVNWGQIANYIEVETQPLQPDTMQEVYRSNNSITMNANQQQIITIYYNQTPCINASASLFGATNTIITNIKYYAWGAEVILNNSGASVENVTIIINAQPLIVKNKEIVIAKDDSSISENGLMKYTLPSNPLIQDLATAQAIANTLLQSFKDPRRDLTLSWCGNPALLLGDRITIADENNDYFITKQEINYDGALEVKLTGRKVE
jgi:hypothetical protein